MRRNEIEKGRRKELVVGLEYRLSGDAIISKLYVFKIPVRPF